MALKDNVLRVAELLQKDSLTREERHEGVSLAGSMFGTQARATGDSVMNTLRALPTTDAKEDAKTATPETHTVIGVRTGNGQLASAQEAEQLDELSAGEFRLGDDVYGAKQDKAGRAYFVKNGKRISTAEFDEAQAKLAGDPETTTPPASTASTDEGAANELPPAFTLGDVEYSTATDDSDAVEYRRGQDVISETDYRLAHEQYVAAQGGEQDEEVVDGVRYFKDGDKIVAVDDSTFVDLQSSPAGFGDTREQALAELKKAQG